jgi:hypothetical protein
LRCSRSGFFRSPDLGDFLAAADLLVLRDGAALVLVLPPEHSWP